MVQVESALDVTLPYKRTPERAIQRGIAIAFAITEIVSTGIAALIIRHAQLHQEQKDRINNWIRQDGFTSATGIDYVYQGGTINELRLGNCTFNAVSFSHDSGGTSYTWTVGTTGEGKFQTNTAELDFDNATQLEAELPQLNCFPPN